VFPICQQKNIVDKKESDFEQIVQKICEDPFYVAEHNLVFDKESYTITLIAEIPNTDYYNKYSGIPVKAELINEKNEILEFHAFGNIQEKRRSLLAWVWFNFKTVFGLFTSYKDIIINITDKFSNEHFDITVLNLDITEPEIFIKHARLDLIVNLKGLRRLMYQWFWTTMFITINFLTFVLYLALVCGFDFVEFILQATEAERVPRNRGDNVVRNGGGGTRRGNNLLRMD
jgi:hypothetical protein